MYLTNARPNRCFAVNTLSQYVVDPRRVHLIATKHVMRYLKGTVDYGIKNVSNHEIRLQGLASSNWSNSVADRKSTSGCCFNLGSTIISCLNRKQTSVALSMPR